MTRQVARDGGTGPSCICVSSSPQARRVGLPRRLRGFADKSLGVCELMALSVRMRPHPLTARCPIGLVRPECTVGRPANRTSVGFGADSRLVATERAPFLGSSLRRVAIPRIGAVLGAEFFAECRSRSRPDADCSCRAAPPPGRRSGPQDWAYSSIRDGLAVRQRRVRQHAKVASTATQNGVPAAPAGQAPRARLRRVSSSPRRPRPRSLTQR